MQSFLCQPVFKIRSQVSYTDR